MKINTGRNENSNLVKAYSYSGEVLEPEMSSAKLRWGLNRGLRG